MSRFILELQAYYQAAYERYQRLQYNTGSKNNVADFAEMPEFESEKLVPSWPMLHSPTHQLVVRMRIRCVCTSTPPPQPARGFLLWEVIHAKNDVCSVGGVFEVEGVRLLKWRGCV